MLDVNLRMMSVVEESVSIIVPTLNEVENIAPLVSKIAETGVSFHEILFVDDGSTDRTRDLIRALAASSPIRLLERNEGHPGLAAAIMAGARAAHGELLLVMDADLSHPPERIKDLLAPLFENAADIVIGSRYTTGGSAPDWPFWRRTLSRTASALAYPLTGVHDSMCGFFAIKRARLLEIAPPTSGFKILFETIVHSGRNLRVREIPIAFRDRVRGHSKMSPGIALRFFCRWLAAICRRLLGLGHRRRKVERSLREL
jgi:dolichol-phosphate mannosyltransferase